MCRSAIAHLLDSKVVRCVLFIQCALLSNISPADHNPPDDPVTLDIFSVPLEINVPAHWKQIRQEQISDMYSAEFLPEHETLNQWNQLICVQGFNNVSDSVSPDDFMKSLSLAYNENCRGDIIYRPLGDTEVNGYQGVHALLGCTKMPNTHTVQVGEVQSFISDPQGEMGYYTVLVTSNKLILFHKSLRGKVFSPNHPPLSVSNYQAFIGDLFPDRL